MKVGWTEAKTLFPLNRGRGKTKSQRIGKINDKQKFAA